MFLRLFTLTGVGSIASEFGAILLELLQAVLALITGAFTGVTAIFWNATTGFTIYGVFLMVGLVLSIVMLAIMFIKGLIGKGR